MMINRIILFLIWGGDIAIGAATYAATADLQPDDRCIAMVIAVLVYLSLPFRTSKSRNGRKSNEKQIYAARRSAELPALVQFEIRQGLRARAGGPSVPEMGRVTVVRLKKGQNPPGGPGVVLIDCMPRLVAQRTVSMGRRLLVKTRAEEVQNLIADLGRQGITTVYVRGLPHA